MKQIFLFTTVFACVLLVLSCEKQASEQESSGPVMEWDETCEHFAEQFLQRLGPNYDPHGITSHARYCFKTMAPLFKEQELSSPERQALVALCLMSGIEFNQSQLEYSSLLTEEQKVRLNQACINEIADMGAPAERVCLSVIKTIAPLNKGKYREQFPYVFAGYYAIFVLQHMKSREAVPILIDIATGELPVRGPATRALGLIGDERAIPVLRKLEHDREGVIRRTAKDAIRRIEQMPDTTPLHNDTLTTPIEQ